jgi:sodium/proline symporter
MTLLLAKETMTLEIATFFAYFLAVLLVAFLSTKKQKSDTDFLMGNRSLNFWLTALSAHASDMSSWLFLAYPAMVYTNGVFEAWAAIGLTTFMFLNWHFIAPRIRYLTEQSNSLTLNSYFETRFGDTSGSIRIISGTMSVLFFTVYISAGLVGLGILVESLFNLPYLAGISLGLAIVVAYVFAGGYRTVAYIDLFQGFFLLSVIVFIPLYLLKDIGGIGPVMEAVSTKHLSRSLFPNFAPKTIWSILMTTLTWGLGYFGQPHIITKFMGIQKVSDMYKAKYLGISWQATALSAATVIGLICIYHYPEGISDPQQICLELVKATLPPVFAGLVLCAILAATTNVMAAQILVVASNLSEDFYKKIICKHASPQELLRVSRISVVLVSIIAFAIAFFKIASIYGLVLYAWSGLGASFGPLLLLSLYSKSINKYGAFAGILVGGTTAIITDYCLTPNVYGISSMVAGFFLSIVAIPTVSFFTRKLISGPTDTAS